MVGMTADPSPQQSTASAEAAQRLQDAMKRLRARLRAESGQNATGLTPTQIAVLGRIIRQGPLTAARLAALEHVSAQAIAQSLTVLKAAGLIHTAPDPQDGRKKLVSADRSATELLDRLLTGRSDFLVRAIDAVIAPGERADVEKAVEILERLADADLRGGGI